jgi:glycerophosphoryl diester phosphodiesterase
MKIIAHRGASAHAPENTLAAFQLALDQGASAIELDGHASIDGQLVVHHDYALGNPDNGSGLIRTASWEYIQGLDAGSWFSQAYAREPIPSLHQVFTRFGDAIDYELELKGTTLEFLRSVIALVKKHKLLEKIEWTSPHQGILFHLNQVVPNAKIGYLVQPFAQWMSEELGILHVIDTMHLINAKVAHLPLPMINPQLIHKLHQHNFLVHAADCNSTESIRLAKQSGCDQLSTNDPALAL